MNLAALPPRLAEKIQPEPNSGCWIWRGAVSSSHRHEGYGSVKDGGSSRQAHLVIWEHLHGPLPPETPELDHVKERCSSKLCVNDAHLEPVTRSENNRRSSCHHHLWSRNRKSRSMRRVHDVGVGLALARSSISIVVDDEDDELVVLSDRRHIIAAIRGPYVKKKTFRDERCVAPAATLTNMAIAFGIAVARSKPTWVHRSTPAAALASAGGDGWTTGLVDLDPRRWRRS